MNKFFFDHPELPFVSDKDLSEVPIVRKYRALFQNLDLSSVPTHNEGVGCSGYSNHSIIKALVFKAFMSIAQSDNVVAVIQQGCCQMTTHEPGAAGH